MKTNLTTLHKRSGTYAMIEPVPGTNPVLAVLMRPFWATVFVLPAFVAQADVVLTTLHSFTGTNDGANPQAPLVQGSDGIFYGTTEYGGAYSNQYGGFGTVFKIGTNKVLATLYAFGSITNARGDSLDGANPQAALVQGSDGNFYGTTAYGGTNGAGTVFKINTNGVLTTLYSFGSITNANDLSLDGAFPLAGLVQGEDGYFYGTTPNGGPHLYFFVDEGIEYVDSGGTVFKISTNGALTTIYAFGMVTNVDGYPLDGANPWAGLVQGSDGNFYGTTKYGGTNGFIGYGTVFKISTNGLLTTVYAFGSITNSGGYALDGANPEAGLVQGSDGNFYGTTDVGDTNGDGTVFKISTNGLLTTLYAFGSSTNASGDALAGANPEAWLVQGSDGNFYGTADAGGTNGDGTVFKISANGLLTTLYAFGSLANASGDALDGANPEAGLAQGDDGSFYGTTFGGGTNGYGTVFRMTIVPELQALILTNGTLSLTWSTEVGGTYQLQYNSDLSLSNWINLGSAATSTRATFNTIDSLTNGPQRFYRLVLLP